MTELGRQDADALATAMAAEHAAIFAYGVVQAYLRYPATTALAAKIIAEHRARRDEAGVRLAQGRARVPVAAPAYTLPDAVVDGPSAARLGVLIEKETAQAWRSLVERATLSDLREEGVRALGECAIHAAQWRDNLEQAMLAEAFPGES